MEKFTGMIVLVAVSLIALGGALNTRTGAIQALAHMKPSAPVTDSAGADAVRHDVEVRAFSTTARDRAILDREWYEGTQERCTARSPFAGLAPMPPAC